MSARDIKLIPALGLVTYVLVLLAGKSTAEEPTRVATLRGTFVIDFIGCVNKIDERPTSPPPKNAIKNRSPMPASVKKVRVTTTVTHVK